MENNLKITADWVSENARYASDSRDYIETEWFLNDLFADGIHSAYYNTERNVWQAISDKIRTVDMYNVILNGLVNSTVKNEPRPEVRVSYGTPRTEEVMKQIKASNVFCNTLYENENFLQVIRDAVKDGYKKNEGWVRVEYRDSDNDGIGEIRILKDSAWNILRDPNGVIDAKTGEFDGDWIIRQVIVPINKVKNNPNYKSSRKKVEEYQQRSPIDKKVELMDIKDGARVRPKGQCLIQEVYYRNFDVEEREGKKYEVLKYYKQVWSGDILLMDETELDAPGFPLFCYQAIRQDGEFGMRPHMSRIIPLNKTLDISVTKMENQIRTMNVGRILKNKSTVMTTLTDEDGQVIEWSGARPPEVMNASGVSGDLFNFYNLILKLIQDTGLFHLESSGGGGNMSGIALAQKQAGDIFNVTEPSENLSVFIGAIFKHVIAIASRKYVTSRDIYDTDGNQYKIIGDSSEHSPSNAVKIKDVDSVKVKIVPGGVYSDVQFKQDMMELYQLQLVDKEAVLEAYNTGKTRMILDRLEEEAMIAQGLTPEVEKAIKKAEKDFPEIIKGKKIKVPSISNIKAQKAYLMTFVSAMQASRGRLTTKNSEDLVAFMKKIYKEWGIPMGGLEEEMQEGIDGVESQIQEESAQVRVPMDGESSAEQKLNNPVEVANEEVEEIQARNDALAQQR